MGRILLLTATMYGYGYSAFDGHRRAALDLPLREFHRAVDAVWFDGRRVLTMLDDARSMRYLSPLTRALGGPA
jgi:hypothetical protein